jgi:hypothetical protein
MKKNHHPTWVKLRAEVIKHFHDTYNKGKINFSMPYAVKLAEAELKNSLSNGLFILHIEEMLMLSLDTCVELARERQTWKLKTLLGV